jgi:hypothetical protein
MNYFLSTISLLLFFLTACNSKADDIKIEEKGVSEEIELIDIKDISKIPSDLVCPKITEETPAAGKRVKVYLDKRRLGVKRYS